MYGVGLPGSLLVMVVVCGYPATRERLGKWRGGRYHRFCPRYKLHDKLWNHA